MAHIAVADAPGPDWNPYVASHPERSIYHRAEWVKLPHDAFGHRPWFIEARDPGGRLTGLLPVVQQRSLLFGNFMTSLPFFNYGGALADTDDVALALMDAARGLAVGQGCSYLELRDVRPRGGDWSLRTDKVTMLLDLPADPAALARQLGSKLRSQVKRADRESPSAHRGGLELLPEFYSVFCENMRDLGTPVYPRSFFELVLRRFPQESLVIVVRRAGAAVAAALLVFSGTRAEIPWASCRSSARSQGFNMKLYWEVLEAVIERGCTQFDFGRSTRDSGTYRFKQQWGARPVQLHWHRWDRKQPRREADVEPAGRGLLDHASAVWSRIPLRLANALGPLVSPSLPW